MAFQIQELCLEKTDPGQSKDHYVDQDDKRVIESFGAERSATASKLSS
jgi:hypothetical protein